MKDRKIFAARRGKGSMAGGWEFPGGKIEPGETAEQAAVREVQEELGAEIVAERPLEHIHYEYPDFILDMDCILCRLNSGEIRLTEHTDARWLAGNELFTVDWLPADIELIRKLEKMMA